MTEIPENALNIAMLALKPHVPDLTPDRLTEILSGDQDRLITDRQAAVVLGVSSRTVRRLIAGGKVAVVKIGRATRISQNSINRFIARNTSG